MTYADRYIFNFSSHSGKDVSIRIQQRDYSGGALRRNAGSSPSLRYERNEHIMGSTLTFKAECVEDDEYSALYTSDAFMYRVLLFVEGSQRWSGYITPELYSAPWIDPPYDVQLTSTDGLGELKRYEFKALGRKTLSEHLASLLGKIGYNGEVEMISTMFTGSNTAASLLDDVSISLDHMAGDTCYDVLQAILTMLDAVIYFDGSRMVIMREADLSDLKQGASIHTASGGSVPVRAFGTMRAYDIWPVGQMSCQIEPARSGVSVSCESHYTEDFVPDITAWSFATINDGYVDLKPNNVDAYFKVKIRDYKVPPDLLLKIHIRNLLEDASNVSVKIIAWGSVTPGGSTSKQYLTYNKNNVSYWTSTETYMDKAVKGMSDGTVDDIEDIEINLPFTKSGNRGFKFYSLTDLWVCFRAREASTEYAIHGASIECQNALTSVVSTLSVSNGARGAADEVTPQCSDSIARLVGMAYIDNSPYPRTTFGSASIAECSIGEFIARSVATRFALPRLRLNGKLNFEETSLSVFFSHRGLVYVAETMEWIVADNELDVSIISIPEATLSTGSIVIKDQDGKVLSSNAVEPTSFMINANDDTSHTINIYVASGQSWQVTDIPSWITFNSTSGTGPGSVNFTCQNNTTPSIRSRAVKVAGSTVRIAQQAAQMSVSVSPTSLSFGNKSGQSKTLSVTTNDSWSVESLPAWLTATPSSGSGNGTITVKTSSDNAAITSREGKLTIRTYYGGVSLDVPVTQAAGTEAVGSASFASDSINIKGTANSWASVGVNESKIASRSFIYDVDWLTVTYANGLLTVTASSNNETGAARSGVVTGTWTDINGFTITDTLTVMQAVYEAPASGSASFAQKIVPMEGARGSQAIVLVSESNIASRSFSCDSDQFQVDYGNGQITITALSNNETGSSRTAVVTGTWTDVNGNIISDTVQVSQAAYVAPVVGSASFAQKSVAATPEGKQTLVVSVNENNIAAREFTCDTPFVDLSYSAGQITVLIRNRNTSTTDAKVITVSGRWTDVSGNVITDSLVITQARWSEWGVISCDDPGFDLSSPNGQDEFIGRMDVIIEEATGGDFMSLRNLLDLTTDDDCISWGRGYIDAEIPTYAANFDNINSVISAASEIGVIISVRYEER